VRYTPVMRVTITILGLITLKSRSLVQYSAALSYCSDPPDAILQLIMSSNRDFLTLDAFLWPELEQLMVKPGQWPSVSFSRSTLIFPVSGGSLIILSRPPRI
jgi:hypothetical protein